MSTWKCAKCGKIISVSIPKGRGTARSNHLRIHGINTLDLPKNKVVRDRLIGGWIN